jgi:hypothetical protein
MIELTQVDREQVKSILMTHAEMQDQRTLQTEEVIGRMKAEGNDDEEVAGMIDDLTESVNEMTDDSENLKRIASKF